MTSLRKQRGGKPEMSLKLALTLFSAVYSVSLEYSITLTYVFIQSWNSTGLFSFVITKSSKANCTVLTFALLAENSSNKIVAFKSFMSYFGSGRSDLMMQNYVNTSGLQTNLRKKKTQAPNILLDNLKLHWPFTFPRLRALLSMIFDFWSPLSQSKRWHFITHVTTKLLLLYIFIFSIVSVGQSEQSKSLL